jgi:hypothetical protein
MTVVVGQSRTALAPRAEWLILALLCTVLLGQLFLSARRLSQTADEPTHLYAGYRFLKCSDSTVSPEHPPLAKIVAAAPLLAMNLAVDCSPFRGGEIQQVLAAQAWLYNQNWRPALDRARIAVSIFALGLCLLVWIAARQMFDLATAITATVLLIFEPNILAYGSLIMTDLAVTCMFLFSVFSYYLWTRNRTVTFLLLTGVATGLALLSKHSAVVVIPILCVLSAADALIERAGPPHSWTRLLNNLLALCLICAIALGVVWVGYGMRYSASPAGAPLQQSPDDPKLNPPRFLLALKNYRLLPEAYLQGFATALSISGHSGPAFLDGKIYPQPPWFSVPFYLLIRNTPSMLALFLIASFGVFATFRKRPREVLFLLIPAAIFLVACARSSMIGGIRYLLPAFPFLLIGAAAGCVELARRIRWIRYALPTLILLHALSSLHAFPNYLSYANEFWGGSANAYKLLPWLDAGQAYPEAKAYLERHPAENCWFITGWQWDPKFYGVPCETFGLFLPTEIPPRVRGTVIVSGTLLTDVRLPEGELAAPFKNLTPKDKIGGSALLVYEGDFDTSLAAAKSERNLMVRAASAGQPGVALMHAKKAVELAPNSPLSHTYYSALLAQIGQLEAARAEASTAEKLLLQDPLRDEPGRKKSLDQLETWIAASPSAPGK